MHAPIPQGQNVEPRFAAEAYIGDHYLTTGPDDGSYSAHPGDYWYAGDDATVGAIVAKSHPYRTTSGRTVYDARLIREYGTVGDLRRLARAAATLVVR